ncbi:MAG: oligosaccharide flippase family protein, partial [Gemmatimonadetes bacterium]|nr:oligosaccharide flippase family protein [Gemmatimonadota bacterium]
REASSTTRNLSSVLLLKVMQYPFVVLFVVLVPRLMGAETYGRYALFTSLLAILVSLTNLGLTEIFGRFVPELRERGDGVARLASNLLALKLVVDVCTAAAAYPVLRLAYGEHLMPEYALLLCAAMLAAGLSSTAFALVFGLNQLGRYAFGDPLRKALGLGLVLVLFRAYGLPGALLSLLLVEIVLGALYFYWVRREFHREHLRVDRAFLTPYLRFGFLFYVAWGLLTIWQRLGNALIDLLTHDSREVALFDMPNQLFSITSAFTLVLISALIPVFTNLLLTGKEAKLIAWSASMAKYTAILCTVIFGSFLIAGRELIPIVIGPDFEQMFPNAVLLLLATFPVVFAQLGFVFSVVYGQPARYCGALVAAVISFVAAGLLLVPPFGSRGCAVATLISSCVLAGVLIVRFRQQMAPGLGKGLVAIGLGALFLPALLLREGVLTNVGLAVVASLLYGVALFRWRILDTDEIRGLVRAARG